MGVTIRGTNNIPRVKQVLRKLNRKAIKVGVFGADNYQYGDDADLVTIAAVHEFGTTIVPKTAKWLTIPLLPEAKYKSAGEFNDLFFYKKDENTAFLARKNGQGKPTNVFLLVKRITIPERSYLRTGFDENVDNIAAKIEDFLDDVLNFNLDPDVFLDAIGTEFAGLIQLKMRRLSSPPNSNITKNVKGSSNPLQDTGRLIGAIRHEVE